ncbi:MAG: protein kinase [Acidobacteriota bacterium]
MIQRRVGSGAFGVVYEAYDRQARSLVALKVLRFAEADSLYRFKKGFRSLADIRHPNLVSFYELYSEAGQWFFSMELVPGVDLIEALSGGRRSDESAAERDPPDFDRIRRVMLQLARALHTVHTHGKVHRDIKPPNVLVTAEDRAVLLDFGLVTEFHRIGMPEATPQTVGTPAYMSPEQALALPGSPASDWYSVGVMLYQALTGELPFQGTTLEIISDKQTGVAPGMSNVPRDLEALSLRLLDPDPEARPRGEEVIAFLGGGGAAEKHRLKEATDELELPFVGRSRTLSQLIDAFEASREGAVMVYLNGASGMGKTALIDRFIHDLDRHDESPVVLSGRCYLQESVPYKALDSLVDALSRYLLSLQPQEVEALLPDQIAPLAVLFPVLLRVGSVADLSTDAPDPQIQRRRAFAALRQLLERISRRQPLVLVIDDLQWGDMDSFLLLNEILKPPDPPPLLLICAYRSEDEATSPFLQALSEQRDSFRWRGVDVRELTLGRLPEEQARALIRAVSEEAMEISSERAESILREAAGSPLFLSELTRFSSEVAIDPEPEKPATMESPLSDGRRPASRDDIHLRDAIMARVAALSSPARRLLEVVAVAGKPVDLIAARQAVDLGSEGAAAVAQLRTLKLIRQRVVEGREEIETYHDRIREMVAGSLNPEALRDVHRILALALESSGRADPETLAVHFQATEEVVRAREYAATAAERAEEALAFERAARLYRLALDLTEEETGLHRYELQVKLGAALANAGRSREAAESYLQAVSHSGTINPIEAQRQAAEQLLISGHVERGQAILRHVLRTVGMRLQKRSWKSLIDLWWYRLRLRLRGFEFTERAEADCDPAELHRIDVCWSVEIGLCLVDVLRASQFHARHLLLALSVGEPERVARGLAMEVFFGAMEGGGGGDVLAQARALADRFRGRYAACLTEMASGMLACSHGEWREAHRFLTSAEEQMREVRTGVTWELDTVRHFRVLAMLHLGSWPALFAELPSLLTPAREQSDLYLEIHLRHWVESFQLLLDDRPEDAHELLGDEIRDWSHQGFHFQHFGHLHAVTQVALYQGKGLQAWTLVRERWGELTRSMIQRIEIVLILSLDLRSRCALAAVAEGGADPAFSSWLLERAEIGASKIERAGTDWAAGLASLLRAGVASLRGEPEACREHSEAAAGAFERCGMAAHAAIASWHCDGIVSGAASDHSAAPSHPAQAWLAERGVRDPERLAAMLAPGIRRQNA